MFAVFTFHCSIYYLWKALQESIDKLQIYTTELGSKLFARQGTHALDIGIDGWKITLNKQLVDVKRKKCKRNPKQPFDHLSIMMNLAYESDLNVCLLIAQSLLPLFESFILLLMHGRKARAILRLHQHDEYKSLLLSIDHWTNSVLLKASTAYSTENHSLCGRYICSKPSSLICLVLGNHIWWLEICHSWKLLQYNLRGQEFRQSKISE